MHMMALKSAHHLHMLQWRTYQRTKYLHGREGWYPAAGGGRQQEYDVYMDVPYSSLAISCTKNGVAIRNTV